jgi:hypothetical protein
VNDPTKLISRAANPDLRPSPKPPLDEPGTIAVTPGTKLAFEANRFHILRLLGEGAMGRVYLAQDQQIEGREVALKVLRDRYSRHPEFRRLFLREIKSAQQFVSPHVNQVRDTGQLPDGRLFLTMDLVDGESLSAILAREGALSPRHALEIARQVLLGLSSGHEKGIVHRDVKPQNIMLRRRVAKTEDNPYGVDLCVLDFGIAGLAAELDGEGIAGTPAYMSPEQAQGQRLDARSDIFAVGVVLYEMIAGDRPFRGRTLREVASSLLETRIDSKIEDLANVRRPIRKILARALEKDREKRFQSAGEFVRAIERSKAYRLPTNVPVWAWLAMGALAIAAIGRGTIFAGNEAELERNKGQVVQLEKQNKALNNTLHDKQNLYDEEEVRAAAATKDAQDFYDTLQRERGQWSTESSDLKRDNSNKDQTIALLRANLKDAETAETEKDGRIDDLKKARDKADALHERDQREIAKLRDELDSEKPDPRRAREIDSLLDLVERNSSVAARKTFDDAVSNNVFPSSGLKGADFVAALLSATSSLEIFDASRDVRSFFEAARWLSEAQQLRQGFTTRAADWIDLNDVAPGSRLRRIDTVLESLSARIKQARPEFDLIHEKAWSALQAAGALQDPQVVAEHRARYACQDHLVTMANTVLDTIRSKAIVDDRLNRKELASISVLPKWAALAGDSKVGLSELAPAFSLLAYAQRFYDPADDGNGLPEWDKAIPASVREKPAGWIGRLTLASRILDVKSGYPRLEGVKVVYRVTQPHGGVSYWEEIEPKTDAQFKTAAQQMKAEWHFQRAIFNDTGEPFPNKYPMTITRNKRKAYFLNSNDSPDLNLLDADDSRTNVTVLEDTLPEVKLPPTIGVSATDLQEFRDRWSHSDRAALTYRQGDSIRWISPVWGLVRETATEKGGTFLQELVYSSHNP